MRMIDADRLMQDIEHYHLSDGMFQHWVEIQPTIEERKPGRWIEVVLYPYRTCSECGATMYSYEPANFCPNCGADMRGEKNEL